MESERWPDGPEDPGDTGEVCNEPLWDYDVHPWVLEDELADDGPGLVTVVLYTYSVEGIGAARHFLPLRESRSG